MQLASVILFSRFTWTHTLQTANRKLSLPLCEIEPWRLAVL